LSGGELVVKPTYNRSVFFVYILLAVPEVNKEFKKLFGNLLVVARSSAGFTLIELLVVIALLGVLASIAIPNIIDFMNKGEEETKDTEHYNVQLVVQVMMIDAEVTELDDNYEEIQTLPQIQGVTAAGGAYSLDDYILRFGGTTAFKQAYDISIDGVVTVD
jgi:prepilin-type N-terminal cleavage/methylation domain-containing protein